MPTTAQSIIAAEVRALMGRHSEPGNRVTQAVIGDVIGVGQSGVSARLKGETPFDVEELLALAEFFDVPITDIVSAVDDARRRTRSDQGNRSTIWEVPTQADAENPAQLRFEYAGAA